MDKNVYKIAWAEGVRREVSIQTDAMLCNHGMTRNNAHVASRAVANGVMNTLLMAIIAEEIQVLKGDPDFNDFESEYPMEGAAPEAKPSPSNYPTVTAREWEKVVHVLPLQPVMYVGDPHINYDYGVIYYVASIDGAHVRVSCNGGDLGMWSKETFSEKFRPLA